MGDHLSRETVRGPWGPPYNGIMADMSVMRCSALHLARRHNWTREEASRLLANLRRAGFVEYQGAWQITEAGRQAILAARSQP
jgi:CRP-like cAMP-binding protein